MNKEAQDIKKNGLKVKSCVTSNSWTKDSLKKQRLSLALKENLRKRKQQMRLRKTDARLHDFTDTTKE